MAIRCWLMRLLLLCVWCSMDTFTVITADAQTLTLTRAWPTGDLVEGDTMQLRCFATNLQSGYFIEWTRRVMTTQLTLATNGISADPRFALDIINYSPQSRIENLIISDVQKEDASTYYCILKDSESTNTAVTTRGIYVNVFYFPSAMYPICFPDGPFTVQEGTTVNMSCTTDLGTPSVQLHLYVTGVVYKWPFRTVGNELIQSLSLSVTAANQGGSYTFYIVAPTAFPGMEQSCTIGPISIAQSTQSFTRQPTTVLTETTSVRIPESSASYFPTIPQTSDNQGKTTAPMNTIISEQSTEISSCKDSSVNIPLLAAFIINLVILIVSLIINIFLLIKHRHLKITKEKETNAPKADPYMELQPTEDKNRVYMEPTTATTTTQDTYYQPVEVENDSPEYEYARPEGSTNTSYEEVRTPQISAERPYQNSKNKF